MHRSLLLLLPLCFLFAPDHPRLSPARGEYVAPEPAISPDDRMEDLARTEPIAFLQECIARYDREVKGYRATLVKQERLAGVLQPEERIQAWFKEKPFSVRMDWEKGSRLAARTLYVEGENGGKVLVQPAGLLALAGIVLRDPLGADATSSARYPITEFGIQVGTRRTLHFWKRAQARGELRVAFDGTFAVPELGGRKCWRIRRLDYAKPEDDGIVRALYYFDPATWLQVGSVLHDKKGELIARYFWKDLRLNPEYPPDTFTRAGLAK